MTEEDRVKQLATQVGAVINGKRIQAMDSDEEYAVKIRIIGLTHVELDFTPTPTPHNAYKMAVAISKWAKRREVLMEQKKIEIVRG